ncbi:stAR-related lipid transfer protein 7, mitochondrial [Hemicordylus capensis]|uniref:stAR-related lipid transfer protein 7, mitochondrial n=1 Tax=Hemicordylus capensis TaxID=884348 RepID=UPI0023049B46|nr:stAR-related lipid transfer protein 7, mitochondrial [Hemicordylus capensis]XP_053125465.1 stAR-related lipid transfer protein 7, mitochondrial [Hemicordylus capensis]XP_053125466.1 stAR-related lipid transfer protein 7, mitochondrial [Hemicordylus capensis]XP_053125467.1 stAR-related lipid transfer protein 7, mitochondrial [Hemicordylus capensis]XP_053125468.1 stAR-related lipid transfer protein 7, mitochondrial [Hemicordylus capensis]
MFHPLQWRPPSSIYSCYANSARFISCKGKLGPWPSEKSLKGRCQWLLTWLQKGSEKCPKQKSLLSLLANQCSYVTGQRVWRAQQIGQLYGNLYSERTRKSLFSSLWRRFQGRHANACKLMAALTGVFLWEEERIKEEELSRSAEEMKRMEEIASLFQGDEGESQTQGQLQPLKDVALSPEERSWESVMDKKHFKLWRRPIGGTHLYQYRVFGTYTDVTPRQFFNVQLDTEYRKKWDSLVIKLEVIERDQATGSEVIHWVTHFPYPMYSRDYVYVRRYNVDRENNLMVLVSRAVDHPSVPEDPEFVRVRTYESQMVIRPHKTFDENGFDYLLTYSDNPQTVFPRYCVSWMVSSGMPDFLEKLHMAALKAKNMEIEVRDYISCARPLESAASSSGSSEGKASVASQEHKGEGTCTPIQIDYA